MRFMLMHKAGADGEAGLPPSPEVMAGMGKLIADMHKAGVLLGAEGLRPSAEGAKISRSGGTTTVVDGPYAEAKEMIGGFCLLQVSSKDEAIEWGKRYFAILGDSEGEVRRVVEAEDFGAEFTPEGRKAEERLRTELAAKQQ